MMTKYMEKLQFSIVIHAPKQKVWETMLNDETYREWTSVFHPGSYYEGDWSEGSDIRFLGPNEDGTVGGMYARIDVNQPHDFISIRHLGEIMNGKETPWPNTAEGGAAHESCSFTEVEGGTKVVVDLDSPGELKEMFEGMWPKALEKLKSITER